MRKHKDTKAITITRHNYKKKKHRSYALLFLKTEKFTMVTNFLGVFLVSADGF